MPFAAPGGEETCQLRVSTTPILEASESSGHVVGVCEYVGLRAEKLPRFAHHVYVIFTYITFFPLSEDAFPLLLLPEMLGPCVHATVTHFYIT